jgi:hypothetical protein
MVSVAPILFVVVKILSRSTSEDVCFLRDQVGQGFFVFLNVRVVHVGFYDL